MAADTGDGEAGARRADAAAAPGEAREPAVDESELDRICLHNLLSASADNIYFKDRDSNFLRASASAAAYTGAKDPATMIGRPASAYFTEEQAAATVEIEQMIMRTGTAVTDHEESHMRSPTGDEVCLSTSKQPLRDFDGRIIGTFGISRDITARKNAESELVARTAELDRVGRELRMLIDTSPDPMSRFDRELRCSYANPAAAELTGLSLDAILGHTIGEMGFSAQFTRDWDDALREVLETGAGVERELSLLAGGREIFLNTRFVPEVTEEEGRVRSILTVSRDLTERRRIEQALAERAVRDPLTGLPNRTLLVSRIKQAIELDADRGRLALLFLDLDRFKLVNDGLGHAVGDELLTAVAGRLRQAVRRGDLVARFGGDEFVVLCENLEDQREAAVVAEHVCQSLTPPFSCAGKQVHMSASIGIALSEGRSSTADSLLRDADAAMYEAKASESATGGYRFFAPAARKTVVRRVDLEHELRRAGEQSEFELVYQPVVELADGRVTGAEALIRWRHPERGLLPPAEFIGIAEDSGLVIPIGRWALETACRQLAEWDRAQPTGRRLNMAVNLSPRQLSHDPDLVDAVANALSRNALPSSRLCLEVTETAVHRASPLARSSLETLPAAGVQFALDDYGTGFSSLAHLRDVPVAALKVDRLFVAGLGARGDDAIVVAVITLAHALGMKVVAEGVETAQQRARLLELGCDYGQGFLFSLPLEPEAFSSLLDDPAGACLNP